MRDMYLPKGLRKMKQRTNLGLDLPRGKQNLSATSLSWREVFVPYVEYLGVKYTWKKNSKVVKSGYFDLVSAYDKFSKFKGLHSGSQSIELFPRQTASHACLGLHCLGKDTVWVKLQAVRVRGSPCWENVVNWTAWNPKQDKAYRKWDAT